MRVCEWGEILRCKIQSVYMMLRLWLESLSARWNTYELREWDWDFRVCMRDVKSKTKNLWMCWLCWLWDKNTQRLCVWGEILRLKLGNRCMRRDIEIELGTVCVCSKVGD